ncbi:ABC transporter ATP-binding protein [Dethiosulfatarculus sandiegensis]|uniref:ABC transporter n=1 Tax=Dethiosulfatarculus sandiegensis TaxID=1429043 RepID=A0A0D2JVV2_9BACT|nr:ATP-binding cassette domain-containing protein [Dethiosulfatarculus sandiegensis]KIX13735.1 ABC transporter [Dethiosulfatarculus sandiegensis]
MFEANGLMVFYENMLALNNVSLACGNEQIIGVFGANSAGKSTLMYTLAGIMLDIRKKEQMAGGERITLRGEISFQGERVEDAKPSVRAKAGIILCPERRRIFPESSVLENLEIGSYLATREQAEETLEYVFEIFPALKAITRRLGGFLSGGEQQMLAIGRALMAQPKLLLLDEPLLGLSPAIQYLLAKSIKEIKEQRKTSVIVAEQYARPIMPIIDHGYILENGSAVVEGGRRELMDNPDVKNAYFGT